jgi:hypothetical protein
MAPVQKAVARIAVARQPRKAVFSVISHNLHIASSLETGRGSTVYFHLSVFLDLIDHAPVKN